MGSLGLPIGFLWAPFGSPSLRFLKIHILGFLIIISFELDVLEANMVFSLV